MFLFFYIVSTEFRYKFPLLESNLRDRVLKKKKLITFCLLYLASVSALFSRTSRFTPRYASLRRKFYTHETRKRDHPTRAGISLALWASSHPQVVPTRSFITPFFRVGVLLCVPLDSHDIGTGISYVNLVKFLARRHEIMKLGCKM